VNADVVLTRGLKQRSCKARAHRENEPVVSSAPPPYSLALGGSDPPLLARNDPPFLLTAR
jgi:hypothetical protein